MGTVPNLAHRERTAPTPPEGAQFALGTAHRAHHGARALILRCRPAAARLAVVLAVAVAAGGAARAEPSDADFLAAKAAFDRGDRARVAAIAPRFAGNLLELMKKLTAVGNDPWPYSALRTPTLVFDAVQFAGV